MRPTRGDGLLTTTQAAQMVGRSPSTIRTWVARGHLAARGLCERGRPLYDRTEVRAAERTVRDNGLRTSGIDPRRKSRAA